MVLCGNCGNSVPRRSQSVDAPICNLCYKGSSSKPTVVKRCIKCGLRSEKCQCESTQDFYVVPTHKYDPYSFQSIAPVNQVIYNLQSTKTGMKHQSKASVMHQMGNYSPSCAPNEPESFQLLRLPVPRLGKVLGIVGPNNIGKTTSVQILSGRVRPNFGCLKNPPDREEVPTHLHESELKNYFTRMQNKELKVLEVEQQLRGQNPYWHKYWARWVLWDQVYHEANGREKVKNMCDDLELTNMDRSIEELSADELSRFMIALVAVQQADVYIFDQVSTFLDVRQRHKAAQVIRSLVRPDRFDLLIFLFLHIESLSPSVFDKILYSSYRYPAMNIDDGFKLDIMEGELSNSQIVVVLGPRHTGKTIFLSLLERMHPNVSYKGEEIGCDESVTVREYIGRFIPDVLTESNFLEYVIKPLGIRDLYKQSVSTLSTSWLQKIAITICLGKDADLYLIDEPSRHMDIEQKLCVSKAIKGYTRHVNKPTIVVENDLIMVYYLADQLLLFEGKAHVNGFCNAPQSVLSGMNKLLQDLKITVRRDPTNLAPRINKLGSSEDEEQKAAGEYFLED